MHDYTKSEIELAVKYHSVQINDTQLNYLLHTSDVREDKVEEIIEHLMNRTRFSGVAGCLLIMIGATIGFLLFGQLLKFIGL